MNVTEQQVKSAAAAAAEVLAGADPQRTLALMDQLVLAKQLLVMVAGGQLIIGQPPKPPAESPAPTPGSPSPPANRKQRRSARHS